MRPSIWSCIVGFRWRGMVFVCAMFAFAASGAAGAAPDPRIALGALRAEDARVVGMTVPSKSVTMAAVFPARIAVSKLAEGSIAQQGDVVILLADAIQRARTEIARSAAESMVDVRLSRVRWEYAKREWDRLTKLRGDDYASSKELSDAYAESEVRRLEHELAQLNHRQAVNTLARERHQLVEYSIRAPFTGYVAEHLKQPGDTVDQLEGIVRLVQLDPIEVVVACPLWLSPVARKGDRVAVRPVDPRWRSRVGTIVLASRVADAASQTFRIKISVPNEDLDWVSGLKVVADFSQCAARASLEGRTSDLTRQHDEQRRVSQIAR